MRALRASTTVVGKRTGRGAKIKLAPRANDMLLARAGKVKLDLPYLMHSLGINDEAKPADVARENRAKRRVRRIGCEI